MKRRVYGRTTVERIMILRAAFVLLPLSDATHRIWVREFNTILRELQQKRFVSGKQIMEHYEAGGRKPKPKKRGK